MPRGRLLLLAAAALLGGLLIATPAAASPFPPTAASLDEADLDRAIAALAEGLLAARDPVRQWEPKRVPAEESRQQGGGYTAIVALALVQAGVPSQDARLAPAIEWLRGREIEGTYALAVRTMLWASLPDSYRRDLEGDVRSLLAGFSAKAAGWDYTGRPQSTLRDNSITQFASLALAMAARRGVEIPPRMWEMLEQRYLEMQLADGGWNYQGRGEARGSMTAAGVATLFMLDRLRMPAAGRNRGGRGSEAAILRGLEWLERHFDPARHPGHHDHFIYWLYSLERAALAGGLGRLGRRDWFREGAAEAIARLCEPDPSAKAPRWRMREKTPRGGAIRAHEHAMGLLYLVRGSVPVAVGVLTDPGEAVTSGTREMAILTEWLGETAQREFNWLRIESSDPIETWLVPAVLWWQPERLPTADDPRWAKLATHLARGGLLVGEFAGLPAAERTRARTTLASLHRGLAWSEVDAGHPLRRRLFPLPPRTPRLEVLSMGGREWAVASFEGDLARGIASGPQRGREAFEAFANLWITAIETDQAWPRLRSWQVPPAVPAAAGGGSDAPLTILAIQHGDRDDPEPASLAAAMRPLSQRLGREVAVVPTEIALLDGAPAGSLAILRGIDAPAWEEASWASLARFADRGGTLLVETCGGRGEFAAAVESALARRLGSDPLPLAAVADLPEGVDAASLRRVAYRSSTAREEGAAFAAARMRAIVKDGRIVVLASREDLSLALLGRPREGVHGYAPATAIDLLELAARIAASARLDAVPDAGSP